MDREIGERVCGVLSLDRDATYNGSWLSIIFVVGLVVVVLGGCWEETNENFNYLFFRSRCAPRDCLIRDTASQSRRTAPEIR